MADPEVEAAWRAEFERIGETQLRDALNSGGVFTDEPKRQAAFRCLGDEAQARGSGRKNIPLCPVDLHRRYRCRDRRPSFRRQFGLWAYYSL